MIFKAYSDNKAAYGLSVEGAQEIVSMLRGSSEVEAPKVEPNDKAVIYLVGLSQAQMEMMVRSCPVKIWQTLIDHLHEEPLGNREEEFLRLKDTIAEALLLMQKPIEREPYLLGELRMSIDEGNQASSDESELMVSSPV